MLKLYYARPSAYARPVWLALLEKGLEFELVPVDLRGEQFEEAFQKVNPFGHVPVLVDDGFRVVESWAILDYLEAKFSDVRLLPQGAQALAKVRMVQSVSFTELLPAFFRAVTATQGTAEWAYGQRRLRHTLSFLEALLGEGPYFAGEQLTLAEVVAGTLVYRVDTVGMLLDEYPKLKAWSDALLLRPSWQAIELGDQEWSRFTRLLGVLPKLWEKQRKARMKAMQ